MKTSTVIKSDLIPDYPQPDSPPLEGWLKAGVDNSPHVEGCPKDGVDNCYSPYGVDNCYPKAGMDKTIVTYIHNIPIKRNFVENLPHNPALKQLARDKRKAGILSEVLFWQQVHQRKFYNIDFDRQRIIGSYIVDFYVKTLGLVVEIDGSSHDNKIEQDAIRQEFLENQGLKVYRIAEGEVKNNLGRVMKELEDYIVGEYGDKPPRSLATSPREENEPSWPTDRPPKEGNVPPH